MIPVKMPVVGQDYKTGTLIEWRKEEGDTVEKGDVILVVESEKAAFDVEAEESGVLLKKLYREGDEAEVLTPVAYIGRPGETVDEEAAAPAVSTKTPSSETSAGEADLDITSLKNIKIKASPVARRIAREKRIDLSEVRGTGPAGRIIKKDVLKHGGTEAAGEVPFSRIRGTIAARLTESWTTKPHFSLVRDIDMESAMKFREEYSLMHSVKISVNDLAVYSVSRALKNFPLLNSHVTDRGIIKKEKINIGIAVSISDGLLVPVIENAGTLSLSQIARRSRELISEARSGGYQGGAPGSFSISNLGAQGIKVFTPIINPPETAILGIGAAERRVTSRGTFIGTSIMMTVSLVCDHRAVDGLYGARFLEDLQNVLSGLRPGKEDV
jgi:pyruvate dehydrogenase E2 component (dihydrolipoamide acetyltransferase)